MIAIIAPLLHYPNEFFYFFTGREKNVSFIHQTKKSSWLRKYQFDVCTLMKYFLISVHVSLLAVEKLFLSSISPKKVHD